MKSKKTNKSKKNKVGIIILSSFLVVGILGLSVNLLGNKTSNKVDANNPEIVEPDNPNTEENFPTINLEELDFKIDITDERFVGNFTNIEVPVNTKVEITLDNLSTKGYNVNFIANKFLDKATSNFVVKTSEGRFFYYCDDYVPGLFEIGFFNAGFELVKKESSFEFIFADSLEAVFEKLDCTLIVPENVSVDIYEIPFFIIEIEDSSNGNLINLIVHAKKTAEGQVTWEITAQE